MIMCPPTKNIEILIIRIIYPRTTLNNYQEAEYITNSALLGCKVLSNQTFKAELIGIIFLLISTTSSGHYSSVIQGNNTAYLCNDSIIIVVNCTDICYSNDSNILFYINMSNT